MVAMVTELIQVKGRRGIRCNWARGSGGYALDFTSICGLDIDISNFHLFSNKDVKR